MFVCGVCVGGGVGGRVLLCGKGQLDCPPSNGLNHYLSLNKTGANSTDERFRARMALLLDAETTEPRKGHVQ